MGYGEGTAGVQISKMSHTALRIISPEVCYEGPYEAISLGGGEFSVWCMSIVRSDLSLGGGDRAGEYIMSTVYASSHLGGRGYHTDQHVQLEGSLQYEYSGSTV
jgi:hypothetical protein